ncbi:MAG: TM1266 family iron-only hydrogenase system putative regulator [Elusimicrobiaceae bacterium]|jgi:putative iron-only hydrogenase system regulator
MEKHVGIVGIIIHNREKSAPKVNNILTEYGDLIVGRMGIPYHEKKMNVISLIVDGTTDQIGAMTGKLGQVEDVTVKCTTAKCGCGL